MKIRKDRETFGFARELRANDLFSLPETGRVEQWKTVELDLGQAKGADYLASSLSCRLCSDKLREVLQAQAAPEDQIQWLQVEQRLHRRPARL